MIPMALGVKHVFVVKGKWFMVVWSRNRKLDSTQLIVAMRSIFFRGINLYDLVVTTKYYQYSESKCLNKAATIPGICQHPGL